MPHKFTSILKFCSFSEIKFQTILSSFTHNLSSQYNATLATQDNSRELTYNINELQLVMWRVYGKQEGRCRWNMSVVKYDRNYQQKTISYMKSRVNELSNQEHEHTDSW
jgi:hypothetical protein